MCCIVMCPVSNPKITHFCAYLEANSRFAFSNALSGSASKLIMNLAVIFALSLNALTVVSGDSILRSTYTGSSGLHDLAKQSGKYMGTAVDQDMKDSAAMKVLKNSGEFGMLTPGNSMKVR
ncbi:unnamed protein product [Phytophthora lilii]|uniref:Unnamed protein product n=1 Tax=Phytophthora lilii TaxID=2077276 RepID=A0A9W6TYM6_9STRA|nr:unnamed protein product [Phytophthora lilii]